MLLPVLASAWIYQCYADLLAQDSRKNMSRKGAKGKEKIAFAIFAP
jgi:hypothetical protein